MSWPEVKRIRKLLPREEMVPGWGQARVECGVLGGGALSPWQSARSQHVCSKEMTALQKVSVLSTQPWKASEGCQARGASQDEGRVL